MQCRTLIDTFGRSPSTPNPVLHTDLAMAVARALGQEGAATATLKPKP